MSQKHWSRWAGTTAPFLIVGAGLWVYHNSLLAPFLFDDQHSILDNPHVRQPWPLWAVLTGTERPIVALSFALNYALGGLTVWGYHAVNLAIHLLAGLTLYGLLRRTLQLPRLLAWYGARATGLALAISLLWVVHPLQTQAVTYLSQRGESLMGLWVLLTLYSVQRGAIAPQPGRWYLAALLSCALGMATKSVMVTTPLLVLLYDRTFLADSLRAAWQQRRALYCGLAATTAIIPALYAGLLLQHPEYASRLTVADLTPGTYALNQPAVLLHYFRLALWPAPLVFDYAWPPATTLLQSLPSIGLLLTLLLATAWALRHRPLLGFLGGACFLLLAPTSSVLPIRDLAVEHRMYLPLAPVLTLLVVAAEALLRRFLRSPRLRQAIACGLLVIGGVGFGTLTRQRNATYASEEALWRDTVAKRPTNPRAHNNLGRALADAEQFEEAQRQYREALRLQPDFAEAHNNLAAVLATEGRFDEAMEQYAQAMRLHPTSWSLQYNLGNTLARQRKLEEAMHHFAEAIRLNPFSEKAHHHLGTALTQQGRFAEALAHHTAALRLKPDYAEAYVGAGNALLSQGQVEEAVAAYTNALHYNPQLPAAHNNLGNALAKLGQLQEALGHYREALRLRPDYEDARRNLTMIINRLDHSAPAEP